MSGSQHNPNGRQAQLGSGWSPLQLQMANLLARAPQAHMASERGVTWHTPTPPPHLYHVPAPSPPDPLQAIKGAGNSVFRHTATPPELYRHTPTPPDKHLLRHTPSPGDVKAGAALPPADMYAHLGPGRDKLVRPEDLLTYARGVDLSLGSRSANGAALSVRDAPTINSLIARAQPRPAHARVDSLLERLAPADPPSVIVRPRAAPGRSSPSSPSSDDSADSGGAVAQGHKRKRKPERTVRRTAPVNGDAPHAASPVSPVKPVAPVPPSPPEPHARRKTRSGSAETIDDIAAMIASTQRKDPAEEAARAADSAPAEPPVSIDKLKSVLASPEVLEDRVEEAPKSPPKVTAAAPAGRSPGRSPARAAGAAGAASAESAAGAASAASAAGAASAASAEPAPGGPESPPEARTAEPAAASFVEVENQLEKMFAGIEEPPNDPRGDQQVEKEKPQTTKARKRRKSGPAKGERGARVNLKRTRKAPAARPKEHKDAYDSGSNASSSKSRGPYIQIRGPRDSPLSVSVMNAPAEEEGEAGGGRRRDTFRNGLRARGLHCSTLGLRYDATTPDATWLCAFCERGPHAAGLGDLFGPYPLDTDCDEYRALDEAGRRQLEAGAAWLHEACAVWAPGVLAAGARLWGLAGAVWSSRGVRCAVCARGGAALACGARGCRARAHVPCARGSWLLREDDFHAACPRHAPPAS